MAAARGRRRLAHRLHRHHGLDFVRPRAHRHDGARLRRRDALAGVRRRHRGADHRRLRLDPQAAQPAGLSGDDHPRRRRQRARRGAHAAARRGRLSTETAADAAAAAALDQAHAARHREGSAAPCRARGAGRGGQDPRRRVPSCASRCHESARRPGRRRSRAHPPRLRRRPRHAHRRDPGEGRAGSRWPRIPRLRAARRPSLESIRRRRQQPR